LLRLFGVASLLVLVSALAAWSTDYRFFRVLTLILLAAVYALYWYLRRSLPARRGKLSLPGLHEPVEVYWDDHGVPHIFARNLHDLYMAQGYVTASDRLWSMDLNRRAASGRLAELFGEQMLPLDRHFRTVGFRRAAEASLSAYSPETLGHLEAYAAGVNARTAERKWPPEFALLRCRPEPWTPVDTLAVGKYLAYDRGGTWAGQLFRAQLVQAVGAEKAAELFPLPPDLDELRALQAVELPSLEALMQLANAYGREAAGCSGWVTGGEKSKSGAPLLANDPHLAARAPAVWYQTHLVGPGGLDVTGAAFPGLPGIALGHNRDIAWGMTAWHADAQDLVVEQRNPATVDEFRVEEGWEKAEVITERIQVRGLQQPVEVNVLVTRHGPVIADGKKTVLALRWAALEPAADLEALLAVNQAHSWRDCREALRKYGSPAQTFLFAGRDGTIAARAAGQIPVRSGGDGQVPAPGWTGKHEWTGSVPFDQLPEQVNPPEGFIVAGREQIWSLNCRSRWVAERLRVASALTPEKMRDLQTECVNMQAYSLLQVLLNAAQEGLRQGAHPETLGDMEKRALLVISGWDCGEGPDSPEAALWHQWYLFLMEEIFRPQMGLALFDQFLNHGQPGSVTEHLVQQKALGEDSCWLQPEGEGSLARVALRSFRRAVAFLSAKQGMEPERWRWGREHKVTFIHALTAAHPALNPILNFGPFPVGGSTATANHFGYSHLSPFHVNMMAPWRQVVDIAQPDEALGLCIPGQSGHPLSSHYGDQLIPWLKGEYLPQLFRHNTIRNLPRLLLQPAAPGSQPPAHHHADAAD
jgi:penicillin G amidase